jgi:maltokinase
VIEAAALEKLLPEYLGRQRWFSGSTAPDASVTAIREVKPGLNWALVDSAGAVYQLLVGTRPATEPPPFIQGQDAAVLGTVDGLVVYDATIDPELALSLLALVAPGEQAGHVRPAGAEQSNTSLVYDDRLILKLYRRLFPGPNPDVQVVTAITAAGFENTPAAVGVWRDKGYDLAVCQQFLAEAAEGWSLALTSLRDFYGADCEDPGDCGGDFAPEAERLGDTTARMHIAMADAFGRAPGDAAAWAELVQAQLRRLKKGDVPAAAAEQFVARLRDAADPGPAIRVHGDYHLGQVLRTDAGWYVLDFEGEPARPLTERTAPSSPLKDVSGMLRSLHYAAQAALIERAEASQDKLLPLADKWEARNREAFLRGYMAAAASAGSGLLPADEASLEAVLASFEFDKAVYELLYERGHRPEWERIPKAALRRLVEA